MLGTRSVDTHSNRIIIDTPIYHVFSKPNRTSPSTTMHFSGKAQQIPTSRNDEGTSNINLNTAVAENSTSPDKCKQHAIAEASIKTNDHCSNPNLTSTSFPSVQQLRGENPLDNSSQKASLADTL